MGFSRIFLETGKKLTTSFLNEKLVDDFKLFVSSKNLGKKGDGGIWKYLRSFLKNKKKIVEKVNLSGDKLVSYKI
jgi:riboflavin biosynthesis pyrimidine reductase